MSKPQWTYKVVMLDPAETPDIGNSLEQWEAQLEELLNSSDLSCWELVTQIPVHQYHSMQETSSQMSGRISLVFRKPYEVEEKFFSVFFSEAEMSNDIIDEQLDEICERYLAESDVQQVRMASVIPCKEGNVSGCRVFFSYLKVSED